MICFWICSTYYLMLAFHIWIEKSKYRSPLPSYHWNLSISRPDRIMNRLAMNFMMKISKHRRQHAAHRRFVLKFRLLPLPFTCLNTFTNLSIDLFRIYFPQNVSWSTGLSRKANSRGRFKTSPRHRHCTGILASQVHTSSADISSHSCSMERHWVFNSLETYCYFFFV